MHRHSLLILTCLLAVINCKQGLFDEDDKVVEYTEKTYAAGLYSGDKAHVFLLYSSYCGHCQKFAPTYKKFAEAINSWSSVVEVTGINCVVYTDVCRLYNIVGYPTIRFMGITTNTSDIGESIGGDRSLEGLIKWTVSEVFEMENIPEKFSFLQKVSTTQAKKWKSDTSESTDKPSVIVVTENEDVGRRVVLDIHDNRVRYTLLSSDAAKLLGAKSAGLLVFSDNGRITYIANVEDDREKFNAAVKKLLNVKKSGEEKDKDNGEHESSKPKYVDTNLQYNLYELDMRSAVNNAFYTEVSLKTEFSKDELDNLKNFVRTVKRCGVWTPEYSDQLEHVHSELKSRDSLNNSDWTNILKSASEKGFPQNSTFIGCEGSKPLFRGYSCSLWVLFHTMLSSCYNSKLPSNEVLQHIHGYIESFFSCSYCRSHFLAMAERLKLTAITDEQEAIIAFWAAHNEVNERLSVEDHDPYFPKIQYPPSSICKKCRHENTGQFDIEEVFKYLLKHYRRVQTPSGKFRIVKGRKSKKKTNRN